MRTVYSSSHSNTPTRRLPAVRRRLEFASSRVPVIPVSMLFPARLHTQTAPLAATASAMRFVVVVLPFVPVMTTLASRRPARSATSSGSMERASLPGSAPPLRWRTERSPQRARSAVTVAMFDLMLMRAPIVMGMSCAWRSLPPSMVEGRGERRAYWLAAAYRARLRSSGVMRLRGE